MQLEICMYNSGSGVILTDLLRQKGDKGGGGIARRKLNPDLPLELWEHSWIRVGEGQPEEYPEALRSLSVTMLYIVGKDSGEMGEGQE